MKNIIKRGFTPYHFFKSGKGFTLIELLVVIAIIGLLASVVLASLNSARLKGSTAAAQQTMKSIQSGGVICLGASLDITTPTETQDGGAGILCADNSATYAQLPAGWIYCDDIVGTQGVADCGDEVFSQVSGTSFSIVAENNTSGDIITCTQASCATTNEPTPPGPN